MIPFFFGSAERRLFGAYEPARGERASARSVVLCNPWGQEYLRAHRSMRQLSAMLAASGYHALRFDYFGSGDSAGEMVEADLRGWERDIETAIEELNDMAGTSRVTLVGMRLGASLAARVALSRARAVEALVLWDPVVSGTEYLEGLERLESARHRPARSARVRPAAVGGGREILGFPLTQALANEIRAIDLAALAPRLPARTLLVLSEPLPSHEPLGRALEANAARIAIERMEGPCPWLQHREPGAGVLPVKALDRIAGWLA
jgi:uncharacterized protein